MSHDFIRQIDFNLPALPLGSYTEELPKCLLCPTPLGVPPSNGKLHTPDFCEACKSLMWTDFRRQIELDLPAEPLYKQKREVPDIRRLRTEEK